MTEVRVYPTARGQWCLRWRSTVMPAPSFWYFETEAEATEAMNGLSFSR